MKTEIEYPNPNSAAKFEFWPGADGRWYWHRKRSGQVTASGSYASRRSCRRALRSMVVAEGMTRA